jgi:hypothetical protein
MHPLLSIESNDLGSQPIMNPIAMTWAISELVSLVCEHCYVYSDTGMAQPSLAALAQVNKSISTSALRQLWRQLPSMKPLLALLPLDLVDMHFDDDWNPSTSALPVRD